MNLTVPTEIPRPEYPRPDFQRGTSEGIDWVNLNGTWEFEFDPQDLGEREGWFETNFDGYTREIRVPYPWESLAAWGEAGQATNANYFSRVAYLDPDNVTCGGLERSGNYREAARHTVGWYRRSVAIPKNWEGQRVILKFGAVDWSAKVWVKGQFVGGHENGYLPFEFDITDCITFGDHCEIVVRAFDPQDHQYQPVGKQHNWYQRTSGIWQTVYLEPRSDTYIGAVQIYPDIDASKVTFRVKIGGSGRSHAEHGNEDWTGVMLRWHCDGRSGKVDAAADTEFAIEIPKAQLRLWDVDSPNLYDVTLELIMDNTVIDRVFTYFGMRKVSRETLSGEDYQYIYLNNRPIYLLGALNQSFNPQGLYTFLTDDAIRADIQRAKEFGFNFLRLHIKIDEPRLYYWADRLGMLFMCDMPNFGSNGYSGVAKANWEGTLRGAIARDFNHPSIIAWCDFNETWGLGGDDYKDMKDRQEWVRQMFRLTKSLDPTRLAEDNSPCRYDHIETDLNSWHFYINDYHRAKGHIADVVQQTYPGSRFNFAGDNLQTNVPLMNSEYGGISARAGDKDVSWCFKYLTNELRIHQKICGYVYTELQDIEWEHNGFMNYDRSIKEFGYDYRDINTLDFIAIDHPPGATFKPADRFKADIYSSHFSHKEIAGSTLNWRLDGLDTFGAEVTSLIAGSVEIPFAQYKVEKVHRLSIELPNRQIVGILRVWVAEGRGVVVARNFVNLEIFDAEGPRTEWIGEDKVILRYNPGDYRDAHWDGEGQNQYEVENCIEMVSGEQVGYFEYAVPLPNDLELHTMRTIELTFEASSALPGFRQTEPEKYPSDVTLSVNGVEVGTVMLPDSPADARGALSYINGIPGKYGYLNRVKIDGERIEAITRKLTDGALIIRYAVKADAQHIGGLALYGDRLGRYPVDPQVVISH